MNTKVILVVLFLGALLMTSCAPQMVEVIKTVEVEKPKEVFVEMGGISVPTEAPPPLAATAIAEVPQAAQAGVNQGKNSLDIGAYQGVERMIIKNAEIRLRVEDVDSANDRLTQIVGDVGGYIISSRFWYQIVWEESYKYGSVTIGVPVDRFEDTLRRLRSLSIKVLDENVFGEDVTDEYVDLESRLKNLEATQDRIREFLTQAKTVEEALKVNEQLSKVEEEIETVKGRMNYLFDRSAYSTIVVSFEPKPPDLTPTPTPTPTLTPTPTSTSTPVPWNPGQTYRSASTTLGSILHFLADAAIWVGVVLLPVVGIPGLIVWFIWMIARRKKRQVR